MRLRLALLAALAVAGVAAAITLAQPLTQGHGFQIEGNRIIDPDGDEFTVKGVVAPYGTFAGGDGGGLAEVNERRAPQDFARLRSLGVNTVKIYVTPHRMLGADAQARLAEVVAAAREQGLLVILTGFWGEPDTTRAWLAETARRYRDDDWVWLLPMNEPGCTGPDTSGETCHDWERWQREYRSYVETIRAGGMESPIVVNTPGWSWNLAQLKRHPLGDDQLVVGAHRYANDERSFDDEERREVERMWAGLADERAVLLDEVGNYDGAGFANSAEWTRGMIDYAADWVENGEGAGVIAFNWRWSDGNSLTEPGGGLSEWGSTYVDGYLERVDE